jgi:hypothetical protein
MSALVKEREAFGDRRAHRGLLLLRRPVGLPAPQRPEKPRLLANVMKANANSATLPFAMGNLPVGDTMPAQGIALETTEPIAKAVAGRFTPPSFRFGISKFRC